MGSTNGTLESEPIILAMQSLKDGGVLDAPAQIEQLREENKQLKQAMATLQKAFDNQNSATHLLVKAVASLKRIAKHKTPEVLPVAFNFPESLVAKLETAPNNVQVGSPVNNVTVDAKALGEVIIAGFSPILKALYDRPVSEVHHVEKSVSSPPSIIEHIHHDSPPSQVQFDTAPLLKMLVLMEKAIRKMPPPQDLSPLVEKVAEMGQKVEKAMEKVIAQPAPKVVQKKFAQNYEGDWIVTEEPVNE